MNTLSNDKAHFLVGQVAVITGAGRGIGAAIAGSLADLGATAVLCGRTRAALDSAAKTIAEAGGKAEVVPCDVTSLESVEAAAKRVESLLRTSRYPGQQCGHRRIRRPAASTSSRCLGPDSEYEPARRLLRDSRLRADDDSCSLRAHHQHLLDSPERIALPNGAAYAASKWGLNGLSYSVAEELRGHNIRVSVICPGSTNTDLSPHAGKDPAKMLQPEDVAHAVAMLVTQSPQSFVSEIILRPTQKP